MSFQPARLLMNWGSTVSLAKIPRTFHYIWVGNKKMPEEQVVWMQQNKELHSVAPAWEFRIWGNEDIEKFQLATIINNARKEAQKADIMRIEIMATCGGVYIDTDTEVFKRFDSLIDNEAFVASQNDKNTSFAVSPLGSVPGSRFFMKLMQLIPTRGLNGNIAHQTGPGFVTEVRFENPEIPLTICPRTDFFPYMWWEKRPARYSNNVRCAHHWYKSWL
jgi:mannosyltransferase OCH1-like enzyme